MTAIKSLFTFSLWINLINVSAQTPNSWTRRADLPDSTRYGSIAFTIDSFGYLGCFGEHRSPIFPYPLYYPKGLWQYNPRNDSWSKKADLPSVNRVGGIGMAIGHKGYAGFSDGVSTSRDDFWEYDPATNSWLQKASFPAGSRYGAVGFSIGDVGYVGLGKIGLPAWPRDFWKYNPTTDTWTKIADFPDSGRSEAIAFSIADKGYAGLGSYGGTSNGLSNSFYEYNPSNNQWTRKADMPGPKRLLSTSFTIGRFGYVMGGTDTFGHILNDLWKYDPAIDTWIQMNSFTGGHRILSIAFSIGNRAYVGTGLDSNRIIEYNDLWEYTPDSVYYTGTNDIKSIATNVSFYPNPVDDRAELIIFTDNPSTAKIELTDINGRHVDEIYCGKLSEGSTSLKVNTKSLSSGLYFLSCNIGGVIQNLKIVKYE